jgi:hypothetical protein
LEQRKMFFESLFHLRFQQYLLFVILFDFFRRVQEDELRVVVRARESTPDSPLCNSDVARP